VAGGPATAPEGGEAGYFLVDWIARPSLRDLPAARRALAEATRRLAEEG
jgi:hypothetical protein